MLNIENLITPSNVITYWSEYKDKSPYLGERLFRPTKVLGTELTEISGREGIPVELKASSFDVQSTFRDRLSVEVKTKSMPFFKEGMRINEKTRQTLLNLISGNNSAVLTPLLNQIFNDTNNLLRGARVVRERMAMELISTGKISINSNGVSLEYDYGLDAKHQFKTPTTKWDADGATPLHDLADMVNDFNSNYGVALGYAVMSTNTFNALARDKSIIAQIYPTATNLGLLTITPDHVRQVLYSICGIRVIINDNRYATSVGGVRKRFYPDGTITLLPAGGILGNMSFGTTPEEADLRTGQNSASVAITDVGVAVKTKTSFDPVNVDTIVSQIVLPSFNSDIEGGAGSILIVNDIFTKKSGE